MSDGAPYPQGGTGIRVSVDDVLKAAPEFDNPEGDKLRLVHRLDKETSGAVRPTP